MSDTDTDASRRRPNQAGDGRADPPRAGAGTPRPGGDGSRRAADRPGRDGFRRAADRPGRDGFRRAADRSRWWLPVVVGAVAVAVLLVALRVGGALTAAIPGLPDPGAGVTWALPMLRLLLDALATLTVGMTVTAAFLLPGDGPSVSARGYQLLRRGGVVAAGWASTATLARYTSFLRDAARPDASHPNQPR